MFEYFVAGVLLYGTWAYLKATEPVVMAGVELPNRKIPTVENMQHYGYSGLSDRIIPRLKDEITSYVGQYGITEYLKRDSGGSVTKSYLPMESF